MPSGFQLDQNQLTPTYYRVTITMQGGNTTWYPVNDSEGENTEGRISALAWDNAEGDNRPNTLRKAQALARGNLRFQAIVEALSNLADCQILDIEHNNSLIDMYDNQYINFTVKFDRDEGVFPAYCAIRKAEGETPEGGTTTTIDGQVLPHYWTYAGFEQTINYTENAIRDIIWKALKTEHTRSVRVFHPVDGSDPFTGEGAQEVITAAQPFDNNEGAWNDITVNEIGDTATDIAYDE
jgi:hypothetical protein